MDSIRGSYQMMCCATNGGWSAMAASQGISLTALQNRVYGRKGQEITVSRAMAMQAISGTTYFAEAVAHESGGLFIKLPTVGDLSAEDIQEQFIEMLEKAGEFAAEWRRATADDEVCKREKRQLGHLATDLCQQVQEILHTTFTIFCKQDA
ncbi:YmfL family putative regulatory protein [Gulbenkiania mobilis]|uniref:YmfL family putative regulatory protein n=1 Tax=Gulbenkiania mobilis TaxID=397457 RepID=UPI00128EEAA5|nr:YmfL family putative regulatory protein [Gulbenkiania mobilis]